VEVRARTNIFFFLARSDGCWFCLTHSRTEVLCTAVARLFTLDCLARASWRTIFYNALSLKDYRTSANSVVRFETDRSIDCFAFVSAVNARCGGCSSRYPAGQRWASKRRDRKGAALDRSIHHYCKVSQLSFAVVRTPPPSVYTLCRALLDACHSVGVDANKAQDAGGAPTCVFSRSPFTLCSGLCHAGLPHLRSLSLDGVVFFTARSPPLHECLPPPVIMLSASSFFRIRSSTSACPRPS